MTLGNNINSHKKNYQYRYGGMARVAPDYTKCAHEVVTSLKWNEAHQCKRLRGYGLDGAYCKQHSNA